MERSRREVFLERATITLALSFVLMVAYGKWHERPHVVEASIATRATPASLFAALLSPDALRTLGEMPEYGRLERVEWSKAPQRFARVTEHYAKQRQMYWVVEWDPPRLIEERYVSPEQPDAPLAVEMRQRWTIAETREGSTFSCKVTMQPSGVLGGLAIALETDRGKERAYMFDRLENLAKYAIEHPVRSATTAIAGVTVMPPQGSPAAPAVP